MEIITFFVTAYDYTLNDGSGGIELVEFPNENPSIPLVKYTHISDGEFTTRAGNTYSAMSAMAMDPSGNIWLGTPIDMDNQIADGGQIVRLKADMIRQAFLADNPTWLMVLIVQRWVSTRVVTFTQRKAVLPLCHPFRLLNTRM